MSEVSVREGLMCAMSSMPKLNSLEDLLLEPKDMRSQALQSSLFSAMAVGGLMSGCSVARVSRHMDYARRCKEAFTSFEDKSALSAYILYAMSHAFVDSDFARREYHDALHQAKLVYQSLEMDPLVSSFMVFRNFMDGTDLMTLSLLNSTQPRNAFGRVMDTTGMVIRTDEARLVEKNANGQGQRLVPRSQGAHPSLVHVDGK